MGSLLGLDFGEKRIGVAVAVEGTSLATGVSTVEIKSRQQVLDEIKKLAAEYQIDKIVVGLPKTLKGEMGIAAQKMSEKLAWYQDQLKEMEWIFWDERLSTAEVERILLQADLSRQRRKEVRDQLAAQRILQNYLDFQRNKP